MDIQKRLELIRGIAEEIITEKELRELLLTKEHPVAYDGFEPSGIAHLPFGIYRALLLKDLLKAGVHFKLWLADWFAWINKKLGGDLEKIQKTGKYFIEVWKAAGVDLSKVKIIWASKEVQDPAYWKRVIEIAKNTTMARATRCLGIMGRKVGELAEVAQYYYPCMQASDIFQLQVDITQLGLDQRRACILAREIAPKLGYKKPVVVSHHMLLGLEGVKQPEGFDENKARDIAISSKMSKSKPLSCIYVHDNLEEIKEKLKRAYCRARDTKNNPVLGYCKEIVFRAFKEMKIERAKKYGGSIIFSSYTELEKAFEKGKLHPLDLKNSLALYLDKLIKPIREYFEKNKKAKELYEFVKKQKITR